MCASGRRIALSWWLVSGALTLWGCAHGASVEGPRQTLENYAEALDQGRIAEAYALLSDEAKRNLTYEAFARIVKENPDEIRDISKSLLRPAGPPLVTATVSTPNGESLLLVYEDGGWRVDGSAIDLYSQASPRAALQGFIRAYENKRYDILMRFVPEQETEGLTAELLKKAWEGEQRAEMERIVQAMKAALPTANFEMLGDRATLSYGAGGTVELVREHGAWKVEDLK